MLLTGSGIKAMIAGLSAAGKLRREGALLLLALALLSGLSVGCYNNNTGATNIGGAVNFKLPAFPETGANAAQIFTEMHYQPSYRTQEGPRLLPHPDSVPVTGRELRYASLEEYKDLAMPQDADAARGLELFKVNCAVCHGPGLKGDGPILRFAYLGPRPADLTLDATKGAADGELFAFVSLGGRQGLSARLRGRESASPMPEFGRLLSVDERWALVRFLRSQIGY